MKKSKVLQLRIEPERLEFWQSKSKESGKSVSQLICESMKNTCGLAPFEIKAMVKK